MHNPRTLILLVVAFCWSQSASAQALRTDQQAVDDAVWRVADPSTPAALTPHYQFDGQPDSEVLRQAKFEPMAEYPPDPYGPQRMQQPTPLSMTQFQEGPPINRNTRPDSPTLGLRLDDTYGVVRDFSMVNNFSEYQILNGGGVTFLPLQTPCLLVGVRGLGYAVTNNNTIQDRGAFSWDFFLGTRYKNLYLKGGPIWDYQEQWTKVGFTFGALTKLPVLGYTTAETAWSWGTGGDVFGPQRDPVTLRSLRVEDAESNFALRLGHFFRPNLQIGCTGTHRTFDFAADQWGIGPFCNVYHGRMKLGAEITGATEGLRAFVNLSYSLGSRPKDHPRDRRVLNVDTLSWVSQPVERGLNIHLRESFTGPLPPGP